MQTVSLAMWIRGLFQRHLPLVWVTWLILPLVIIAQVEHNDTRLLTWPHPWQQCGEGLMTGRRRKGFITLLQLNIQQSQTRDARAHQHSVVPLRSLGLLKTPYLFPTPFPSEFIGVTTILSLHLSLAWLSPWLPLWADIPVLIDTPTCWWKKPPNPHSERHHLHPSPSAESVSFLLSIIQVTF